MLRIFTLVALSELAASASPVRRLSINGSTVIAPEGPLLLRGFSFMYRNKASFDTVTPEDRSLSTLLPKANLARLVMVHWDDSGAGEPTSDCRSSDMSTGYIAQACLRQWDAAVSWAAEQAGLWVKLTLRAALAAGDGGDGHTVFTNATMRSEMVAMWGFIASRYANVSSIAGYEVMSEPRVSDATAIHLFHQEACGAVWKADQKAVCFIGPGPYYDRNNLGRDYILDGPVIYTANFFEPNLWVSGANKKMAYGDTVDCCEGTKKTVCGGVKHCNTKVTFDKQWLSGQLDTVTSFSRQYNVPVYIDQWGVHADSGGGDDVRKQYLDDILDLFESAAVHWAYWDWRQGTGQPGDFQIWSQDRSTGEWTKNELTLAALAKHLGGGPTPAPTPGPPTPKCAQPFQQCGGKGWTGPTCCVPGYKCVVKGPSWSSCKRDKPVVARDECVECMGALGASGLLPRDRGETDELTKAVVISVLQIGPGSTTGL